MRSRTVEEWIGEFRRLKKLNEQIIGKAAAEEGRSDTEQDRRCRVFLISGYFPGTY